MICGYLLQSLLFQPKIPLESTNLHIIMWQTDILIACIRFLNNFSFIASFEP